MKTRSFFALTVAMCTACALRAAPPPGGLTIAVSADGSRLVAGGDTRTILVLDPATLEVKERRWIEVPITGLAFNKDGSILAVHDTSETVHLYSTADWSRKAEIPKRSGFCVTTSANLFAGFDGSGLFVHSLSDGSLKTSIPGGKGVRIAAAGFNAGGTTLAVLGEGAKDPGEPEVAFAAIPKNLKGLALEEFKQKNDGKTAALSLYDPASGKKLFEKKISYTSNAGSTLVFGGEDIIVVNYSNVNARISPAGDARIFQCSNSFNYGIGCSADHNLLLTGGLGDFTITKTADLTGTKGACEKLPGWPEYWKGFSGTAGGNALFGATSAFRVFLIDAGGKVVKSVPVR